MNRTRKIVLLATGLALIPATAAVAGTVPDRAPTAQERAAIERVLRANGFTAWDDIELDDGRRWEVDDARNAKGERYDLKLDKDSYRITRRTRDD